MERSINLIKIDQPIGRFYIGSLDIDTLIKICEVRRRSLHSDGIQRDITDRRIREIGDYCTAPDATFPTSIVLALKENHYGDDNLNSYKTFYEIKDNKLYFDDENKIAEIIDGQHRIWGIKYAKENEYITENFDLPVVFMENLRSPQKGYIFSTINSTQTKVSKSLIYDLFDLSEHRSPQKTCNIIARAVNSNMKSPFYRRLKMLGTSSDKMESISQGSFIGYLMNNITRNEQKDATDIKNHKILEDDERLPLRYYFINNQDDVILKIIMNLFTALKNVFPEEWENPKKYILSKPIGYGAVMKAFPQMYELGTREKDLSMEFFENCFKKLRKKLKSEEIELTSQYFISGKGQSDLAKKIVEALDEK